MIVVVGLGQLGGVFARGFLRLGHPVVPVHRDSDVSVLAQTWSAPELVLVAVGEKDLADALSDLPAPWRHRVGLVQNELLPGDWEGILSRPTVMSVWFEKRETFEARVMRPSPVYGPQSDLMADALAAMGIPAQALPDADRLLFELVVKNVYILAKNAAGLAVGGDGRSLWSAHADLAEGLVDEALAVQEAVTGQTFDRAAVVAAVREGFDGGPEQKNLGRSAPARVARAVALANAHRVAVPTLRRLADAEPRS